MSDSIETPIIQLRIPAPWGAYDELVMALDARSSPYKLEEGFLVHRATGWKCECGASPHDDELGGLFEHEGGLSKKELEQIADHAVKVHLSGPGGSSANARKMMDAGTALLNAGAFGVMIDNSGLCHGKEDWLKLAGDKEPGGLYWAWVNTTFDRKEQYIFSTGMHCLGLRDAEIPFLGDEELTWIALHNFLGYTYGSGEIVLDGDAVGAPGKALFHVRAKPDERVPAHSPFHNPYGIWRLEPASGNEDDGDGDETDN